MGWVANATPCRFTPGKRPDIHCIGGWVSPRTGLNGYGKSRRYSIPRPSSPSHIYTDCAIPSHVYCKNSFKNCHTVVAMVFEVVFSVHVFQLTFVWILHLSMLAYLFCEHQITLCLSAVIHDTVTEVIPLHK